MDRLGDSVRGALRGVGVPDAGALADLTRAWPGTVGDAIARAAWPRRMTRDGVLHVATVSSTWAFELGHLAAEIQHELALAVPAAGLSGLRFTPGPVPAPPAPPPEQRRPPRPTPGEDERRAAAALAAAIDDPQLRESVARAAAASLARAAADRRF